MTKKEAIEQLNGAEAMLLNRKFEEFNEAINVALDALEETEKQRWISVKERLPEDGELVLVLASGKPTKNITLADAYELAEYSRDENGGWILEMWPQWEGATVTHWMPLPEPPEEDA